MPCIDDATLRRLFEGLDEHRPDRRPVREWLERSDQNLPLAGLNERRGKVGSDVTHCVTILTDGSTSVTHHGHDLPAP